MPNILSKEEAKILARQALEKNENSSKELIILVSNDEEEWIDFYFFGLQVKRVGDNEDEPYPVGTAVGIKVSKTTKEVSYVSGFELSERKYKRQLRDDMILLLEKFHSGQKIAIELRKKFKFSPSDILKINKELQDLDFEDEVKKTKYIQKLEKQFLGSL